MNTHIETAATDIEGTRAHLVSTIEKLITILDRIDGDAEKEPWLGAPECCPDYYGRGSQQHWAGGDIDDREDDPVDQGEPEEYS